MKKFFILPGLLLIAIVAFAAWDVPGPVSAFMLIAGGGGGGSPSALYQDAVAVWDFENNATDTKGTSGYTFDAQSTGPSYSSSGQPVGDYWAVFNGTTQTVELSDADCGDAFDLNADYTVAFWINISSLDNMTLVGKGNGANGWNIVVNYNVDNRYLACAHWDNWSGDTHFTTFAPSESTLYHIIISYNSTSGNATVWVSSSSFGSDLDGATLVINEAAADSDQNLIAGGGQFGYAAASIDELVIWNRTINSTEAAAIFNKNWR